ncbi:HEAT repeat-containing protein 3-like [Daphnia carinata]|uniref:HEAT repeat-containing protein 3-like n=1 Tax=Daphnia carinata TaxID=120202 RepID=UPI00257C7E51|nr:HEAT repeat-containing protein 3-like [Daphnia carinata]
MGKSKANRHNKQARDNPTGLAAKTDSEDIVMDCGVMSPYTGTILSSETLKSLSSQLQSSSVEDRDCACHALAGLIRNNEDSCAALHEGLIKVLGPLLLDTSASVCHSAASALHTIVSKGGDQAVKLAIEHDILTPLTALLKRIPAQWKPHQAPGDKLDTSTATFIETVGTLSVLSESSSLAVDRMHRENVVSMLISYLDVNVYGLDVVTTVVQFLSTVTEDQGDTDYTDLLRKEAVSKFLAGKESSPLLRTLSLMILLNLNHQQLNSELGQSTQEVIEILTSSLSLDQRKAASHVVDDLPTTRDEERATDDMEEDLVSSRLYDAVEAAEELISAQIKSLEILTNICCSGDDADSDEFYEDESVGDESLGNEGLEEAIPDINPELKKAFVDAQLFQLVIEKAKLPATNIVEALNQHRSGKSLLKRYEALQCMAFLCLSNMVMAFDVEDMGGSKELFDIWCSLAVVAFQGDKSDQMLAAATASMRAIIRKLSFHKDIVNLLKLEDITLICQRVEYCQPQSKVNVLQILGTLGSMAAGVDPPLLEPRASIVRGVGQILLDTACLSQDLWVTAEAMDALFDVFKEDHTDPVVSDIQLVERLKSMAPTFKHRVHSQRRSLAADQFPVVMTARDNLLRFIKYKTKQRSLTTR